MPWFKTIYMMQQKDVLLIDFSHSFVLRFGFFEKAINQSLNSRVQHFWLEREREREIELKRESSHWMMNAKSSMQCNVNINIKIELEKFKVLAFSHVQLPGPVRSLSKWDGRMQMQFSKNLELAEVFRRLKTYSLKWTYGIFLVKLCTYTNNNIKCEVKFSFENSFQKQQPFDVKSLKLEFQVVDVFFCAIVKNPFTNTLLMYGQSDSVICIANGETYRTPRKASMMFK